MVMKSQNDYYELLRISRDASPEVIVTAYRTLMAVLGKHPDLGGDVEEAVLINLAYEVLRDPVQRQQYDAGLNKVELSSADRRRQARRTIDATISYCLAHDGRWYPARVKDVSSVGARLLAREPLKKGQRIVIACSNPAAQAIPSSVRWSRMSHPTLFERVYEAGVEFETELSDIDTRFSI